jgi:hypothetical protein
MKETIEEAACKALGYDYNDWVSLFSKDKSTVIYSEVTNWCKGAKWQQERSYSEEEVLEILCKSHNAENTSIKANMLNKWFEQFKNK